MSINLTDFEQQVLDFWKKENIFSKTLDKNKSGRPFVFYDGPPFATGTPHHGHLTASTIKDVIGRYFSMKGCHVPRRWGWDCHGLPIEGEIHKKLDMTAEKAVEELGIAKYNDECRAIVQRYTSEWKETVERLGRWVDFDGSYKTMDLSFMESVWWCFKQLWDKGLIYQGTKVMPFSTALGTPLSNFEATSNYQDIQDPAITVLFKLRDFEIIPTYLAAWTTTPWTLPSNLAIGINSSIEYCQVWVEELQASVIIAKNCLDKYKLEKSNIQETFFGKKLVGSRYEGFGCVEEGINWPSWRIPNAYTVIDVDFVKTDTGTGIIHLAPGFGEDDNTACKNAGIEAVCPVDNSGMFTAEVDGYKGLYVKEADRQIIRDLKSAGYILKHETINHSYPHCPRTDTPLIYKLVPCWYIAVEKFKDQLIATNQLTNWVPEHIKDGRFGNWLENAKDWCVSRNRVWGTPIPIWVNDTTGKTICIGSLEELKLYTGISGITDLHREHVDSLTFSIDGEEGTYTRIPEIFDCWFESGAMPYAQSHYPFENADQFAKNFPADFIAEGQDQTRGWFYTLLVLSTALFDQPAFKNVIVNGIVLAADGKKMAKRLKNYTDPALLLDKYGADALRLYLLNSGLTRSENLKFKDSDIEDGIKNLLLPWYNATKFFVTYASIDGWTSAKRVASDNILDNWILEECHDLTVFLDTELKEFRLYNLIPRIVQFMDSLTNTYIRLNRRRFWANGLSDDKSQGYSAYFKVLSMLCTALAPLTPFLAEYLYLLLKPFTSKINTLLYESVHLCDYPNSQKESNQELLNSVRLMQQVILLGRKKREEANIEVKTPLNEIKIIHSNATFLSSIQSLELYIKSELNVKRVSYHQDEDSFVEIFAKPNFQRLGKRLSSRMAHYKARIENLSKHALMLLESQEAFVLDEETFSADDILIFRRAKQGTDTISNRFISIELDCKVTPILLREGLARKIVSCLQNLRKQSNFELTDRIKICYKADELLGLAIEAHKPYIMEETLAKSIENSELLKEAQEFTIDGQKLFLNITAI